MDFDARKHSIIYAYRGSIAHNLQSSPIDDIDYMGVCIAPIEYYFGLCHFEQYEKLPTDDNNEDIVIYDIKKFFRLLLKSNPNVISLLWNKPEHHIRVTDLGRQIIDNRDIFSSQLLFDSFFGYAYSQLKKMTHGAYRGYMGAKRKALVDKYGYDTKNACHLVRLLIMGTEFLNTGQMKVYRDTDRDFLLDIKKGKYTFEEINKMAEELFVDIKQAKEKSALPPKPDHKYANKLLTDIMHSNFSRQYCQDTIFSTHELCPRCGKGLYLNTQLYTTSKYRCSCGYMSDPTEQ